jgi:hypothetical protein
LIRVNSRGIHPLHKSAVIWLFRVHARSSRIWRTSSRSSTRERCTWQAYNCHRSST